MTDRVPFLPTSSGALPVVKPYHISLLQRKLGRWVLALKFLEWKVQGRRKLGKTVMSVCHRDTGLPGRTRGITWLWNRNVQVQLPATTKVKLVRQVLMQKKEVYSGASTWEHGGPPVSKTIYPSVQGFFVFLPNHLARFWHAQALFIHLSSLWRTGILFIYLSSLKTSPCTILANVGGHPHAPCLHYQGQWRGCCRTHRQEMPWPSWY